jgi:hypothetical protein
VCSNLPAPARPALAIRHLKLRVAFDLDAGMIVSELLENDYRPTPVALSKRNFRLSPKLATSDGSTTLQNIKVDPSPDRCPSLQPTARLIPFVIPKLQVATVGFLVWLIYFG